MSAVEPLLVQAWELAWETQLVPALEPVMAVPSWVPAWELVWAPLLVPALEPRQTYTSSLWTAP
jgi:hypothetical protein